MLSCLQVAHAKGAQDGEGGTAKEAIAYLVRLGQTTIKNALEWADAYREWSDNRPVDKRREYNRRYVFNIDQKVLIAKRQARERLS
jgi:hypothetical protein